MIHLKKGTIFWRNFLRWCYSMKCSIRKLLVIGIDYQDYQLRWPYPITILYDSIFVIHITTNYSAPSTGMPQIKQSIITPLNEIYSHISHTEICVVLSSSKNLKNKKCTYNNNFAVQLIRLTIFPVMIAALINIYNYLFRDYWIHQNIPSELQ